MKGKSFDQLMNGTSFNECFIAALEFPFFLLIKEYVFIHIFLSKPECTNNMYKCATYMLIMSA